MTNKQCIQRLVKLLIPYKLRITVMMFSLVIAGIIHMIIPILSKEIMDNGFLVSNMDYVMYIALIILFLNVIDLALDVFKNTTRIHISQKIEFSLFSDTFRHIQKIEIKHLSKRNSAEIFSTLMSDVGKITSITDDNLLMVLTQLFSLVGGVIGLVYISPKMTIVVLLFLPVKYWITRVFSARQSNNMLQLMEHSQDYAGWLGDCLNGVREIRLLGLEKLKWNEFADKQKNVLGSQKRYQITNIWSRTADVFLIEIITATIYILGASLILKQELSVGSIFAFITYSAFVTEPISSILDIKLLLSGIIPATRRYYHFMDLSEEPSTVNNVVQQANDLLFDKVSFSYDGKTNVINDLSLAIGNGKKVALVGLNGSGKTTILNLLLGLYKPTQGKICLGKTCINDLDRELYRSLFSVVSQDIYLFNDTIRNNLTLFQNIDEDRIEKIAKKCGLQDFLEKVGLDYFIGNNGALLSGGQKQKIALVRALIQDRPFMIFDEATSNSDKSSEMLINKLIDKELSGKTIIISTHRTDILKCMDIVAILENGKITTAGTYDQVKHSIGNDTGEKNNLA